MANLSLKHVYKVYQDGTMAVSNFDLEIEEGEFVILVGPSGCGKSTTLRMIAGLEDITAGDLYVAGKYANLMEPKDRNMAMVFQNYALYPHMNVYENMAFGLRIKHLDKTSIDNRVKNAAAILGLTSQLEKKPKDMSGGQRQRVALGRAIVRNPSVFLLDEPLSNLDAKLRASMRTEIKRLHNTLKITFIYVTHDQIEAMTMGTKIVVMNKGVIQQVDSPMNLYDYPCNMFVAGFIGTPQMNFFDATIFVDKTTLKLRLGDNLLSCPLALFRKLDLLEVFQNPNVKLGVRPEHMRLADENVPNDQCLLVNVNLVEALGNETVVEGTIKGSEHRISIKINRNDLIKEGSEIKISIDFSKIHIFSKETTNSICPRIPTHNYMKFSNNLFGKKFIFPKKLFDALSEYKDLYIEFPIDAVIKGDDYCASVLSCELTNQGFYLLELQLKGDQILFAVSEESISAGDYHFSIKQENISFYNHVDKVLSSMPRFNHVRGKLVPNKRPVLTGKKMKKRKVFDYSILGVCIRPNDESVNKIYALLGKKFHLHDIDFSFSPDVVSIAEKGIKATLQNIIKYSDDSIFGVFKHDDVDIVVKLESDSLNIGQETHLAINAEKIKVRDINFDVIII